MDPAFLGNITCFNVNNQCKYGEENSYKLMTNPRLEQAFEEGCQKQQPSGTMIRCCPLDLINKPYNPTPGKIPIHVKQEGNNNYRVCPENITSSCIRETNDQNLALCVAQKCNDAGYLEAYNYYQICKAYKMKGEMEDVPDCSNKNCESMMTIPDVANIGNIQLYPVPPAPVLKSEPIKKSEFTLGSLLDKLPKAEKFYQQGSLILGVVAMIIILIIIFIFPLTPQVPRMINYY